ncbi:AraC family transcriptional regulator [Pedobacter foliorum]|uniref:helix-turn-helix domain-containing protein n=1 Tax=Pedobacter foliorum TaxID=2739058 RepID=UPI0015665077|nr:helix-turn-helix domain-containing protein [Pedobacter foliorum]NRF38282.1 helix-turn-helix domain-containing protein [Pedobacter foliorum]
MQELISPSGEQLLSVKEATYNDLSIPAQSTMYTVLFIKEGKGLYHADFGIFPLTAPALLFSTPLQVIYLEKAESVKCTQLQFHGDFYCIEFHRTEVRCNGLLFNNIYIDPIVGLTEKEAKVFESVISDLKEELNHETLSDIVPRAYLQLFLAKSSSIKMNAISNQDSERDELMERFSQLLEEHYLSLRKPADYAELLSMSRDNFTRRCTRYFRKSPSQLIQERLILEAKKQLHLTRQSIKEIAYNLQFQDEFYFSRVFKKFTKVSPQGFRDKTGISIVADMSKD